MSSVGFHDGPRGANASCAVFIAGGRLLPQHGIFVAKHTQVNNVRNFLRDPTIASTVARLREFARSVGFTEAYRQADRRYQ